MQSLYNNSFALIIGVGNDLPITVKDAEAFSAILKDQNRCAFASKNVMTLTENKATKKNIIDCLDTIASRANEESTVIIYFSGHGTENPDFYLIPNDYDANDINNSSVSAKMFSSKIKSIQSKKIIILLDCCHAGGQAHFKDIKAPLPSTILEKFQESSGQVIIASSRKNEVSWTDIPYSIFTNALMEAFAGYGSFEEDGFVRIIDLAFYINRKVVERTGDKQHPIMKIKDITDNFVIAWYAAGAKTVIPFSTNIESSNVRIIDDNALHRRKILESYRESLLLIEIRISEYINYTDVPMQLLKSKLNIEKKIVEWENI